MGLLFSEHLSKTMVRITVNNHGTQRAASADCARNGWVGTLRRKAL
jgi:hypothetical protein